MLRFFTMILGSKARKPSPTRRASQRARTILGVEELAPRVLPNAGPMSLAGGHLCGPSAHAALADSSNTGTSSSSSSTASMAGDSDSSSTASMAGDPCAAGATLVANLSDSSGATGQASFNATSGTLKVTVQGATASTSLPVTVDGNSVGSVTTGASGSGQATLANVSAQAGSTITVGDLTGTFTQARLTAALTGATGVTGNADYNVLKNQLYVSITGAAASTTYNVTVDGVVVGQLTTNSSGAGKLHVSPASASLESGSTISIADTLGDAAILQGTFA